MNYIDLIFIIILAYSAYKGFSKGFVIYAASFVALILGILGAMRFSWFTVNLLTQYFELSARNVSIISFAVTFIAIVIGVHFLARVMDKIMKAVALGFLNRIFGLLFSLAKTGFIISVVLVIFNTVNEKTQIIKQETLDNSIFYKPIANFAPSLFPNLNFDNMNEKFRHIKQETIAFDFH
ncbi:MAG: CvpA family protein [Bacteroidetes bacterium]|jgi:membrane protein required for colicin V production|nr:CvpA family protein [Bacteroidota bacterium]